MTLDEVVNNYVFQNKYKEYFTNDISKILKCIPSTCRDEEFVTKTLSIRGIFNNKERIINLPNIFSYAYSANQILKLNISDFGKLNSPNNTMNIDAKLRKFAKNSFTDSLDNQLSYLLTKYEYLYKIDISNFYGAIYTHVFEKLNLNPDYKKLDAHLRRYNNRKTNCLLLGNILSTLGANEIMEYLSVQISKTIKEIEIKYFSDQFYIFFNDINQADKILLEVKKIIGQEYFEFEVNEKDSEICTYETLIKKKEFSKEINRLFEIQRIPRNDVNFFDNCDIIESNEKLIHFFNALIEKYFELSEKEREVFVEITFRRVFKSSINLFRLKKVLEDNTENNKRIVEILFYFIKYKPSLILVYIELGIWHVLKESNAYIKNRMSNQYLNYFKRKYQENIEDLDAIYYFHIYYLLNNMFTDSEELKKFQREYKKQMGRNLFLDAIVTKEFNYKISRKEAQVIKFNDESWLKNYMLYLNSKVKINQTNNLEKMIANSKSKKIEILRKLSNIEVSNKIIDKLIELEEIHNGKKEKL